MNTPIELPPLDADSVQRVIRSHRAPRDYSVLRGLSVMAVAAAAVASLSTSVVVGVAPSTPQAIQAPSIPLSVPDDASDRELDAELRRAERAARQHEARNEKPKPMVAPAQPSRAEAVISYAIAQLGKPYRWARSGPSGFDCSGLVVAAFRTVGVTLYHYTGEIVKHGVRVSRSELQRGDVVFPLVGHVGIYLGNNQMIHASSSKGQVVIGNVYAFYTARRI